MSNSVASLKIRRIGGLVDATSVNIRVADTFFSRLVGLLSRKSLTNTEGLLLKPCASIHTIGMRFSIDVVFLDRENKVLGFADSVQANRFRFAPRRTASVLEIAEGNRIRTGINLDDYLIFD